MWCSKDMSVYFQAKLEGEIGEEMEGLGRGSFWRERRSGYKGHD